MPTNSFYPLETKHRPRRRRQYGTSHLKLASRVDVVAPSGTFTQTPAVVVPQRPPVPRLRGLLDSPLKSLTPRKTRLPKHIAHYNNWVTYTIPHLIPAYMSLLRLTKNLQDFANVPTPTCSCMPTVHRLRVVCALQDRIEEVLVCSCSPAVQLIQMGFFPASPKRPGFAFDLRMLEFSRELYLRSTLNLTAWCGALDAVLVNRGFPLHGRDIMRRKFAVAMKWYTYMASQTELVIDQFIDGGINDMPDSAGPATDEEDHVEDHEPQPRIHPSLYLQSRCPLCFSPARCGFDLVADVIVCLDANFTQKRRNPSRGQDRSVPLSHPTSVFLKPSEVASAEKHVESLRKTRSKPAAAKKDDDHVEPGMKVPASALDGCQDSFVAADEKRTKASTKLFSDTGLMGMLCRHDRVLWLVNMTTAGERQYFAIALLLKLFSHLPQDMRVGVLYDIACQLHRSCVKWDFLGDFMARIVWSVSVFHAYGHQWPCQLIYHPRKCIGFGLSDGEGCERFWDAIKILIPSLRVSGHHQRLFAIDNQVAYLTTKSLRSLGVWMARKWKACSEKEKEALAVVNQCGHSIEILEAQWILQVQAQTSPLTKVSKNSARKAVENILALVSLHDSYKKDLAQVTSHLNSLISSTEDVEELAAQSLALSAKVSQLATSISERKQHLGVEGRKSLAAMASNKFLQLRLNAVALKERVQAKVQNRKFELERLDRASRNPGSSDTKLQAHIQSQVSRHQPNIIKLVKRYNDLCSEMGDLVRKGKAPRNAIVPRPIDRDTLFSLDVDNSIWDSRGLSGEETGSPPLWMVDEGVISGIRAWLQLTRCEEEAARLTMERSHMQLWCCDQWYALSSALDFHSHPDIVYHLHRRRDTLFHLIDEWSSAVGEVPGDVEGGWGPSEEDLSVFRRRQKARTIKVDVHAPRGGRQVDGDDDDDWNTDSESEIPPDYLLETVDDFYLADLYDEDVNA